MTPRRVSIRESIGNSLIITMEICVHKCGKEYEGATSFLILCGDDNSTTLHVGIKGDTSLITITYFQYNTSE